MDQTVVGVHEFVAMLNQTLEFAYPAIQIEGEVSGYRGPNRNGHHYLTLKDDLAQLKVVAFRGSLDTAIEDGMKVIVSGSPHHHETYGFSFVARSLTPSGEGHIKRALQLLKQKLEAEGLFAPERKRPLPDLPVDIGVVSSSQAAGWQDFLKIINERWGGLTIRLADVQVQGEPAIGQIVRAIEHFNQMADPPDVLVVTRGGGSLEDLMAFSSESVVRAVTASRIPTLVAVGHEIDTSLADLAADVRAATPSEAARLLVPDRREFSDRLDFMVRRTDAKLERTLAEVGRELRRYSEALSQFITRPLDQTIELQSRLIRAMDSFSSEQASQLTAMGRLLSSYNPKQVLRRGYAIIRRGDGLVRSVKDVTTGDRLMLELSDGTIDTEVRDA